MINKSRNESTLEKIYKDLESGMPENKSIKEYVLPNARQWLGGRFVAIWVLPIYFLRKIAKFSASSDSLGSSISPILESSVVLAIQSSVSLVDSS